MTQLSVNINKIATLRNARGGGIPSVLESALKCQIYGANGITVHPRPDERHITKQDVYDIKPIITTEYNIEGYPSIEFMKMVLEVKPDQVTLVPDSSEVLTSCAGWDTIKFQSYLHEIILELKEKGIRTSIFIDPNNEMIEAAKNCETDRIELYTESYAINYNNNKEEAIAPYLEASKIATRLGIGINAGHDLNMQNLGYFCESIPNLEEVSIGHALISDALYLGLENTIQMYKRLL